ncbi:MAG: FKBP-type peptidyl-prolyl cis-trans isomerase [Bacteroidetes bacterium]|nr:FKBP-type peptidyl-prolyl cis-trans isomerase [Bacteroidota bacterium]
MKNSIIYLMVIGLLIAGTSCQQSGTKSAKLETSVDSVSYAIGILVGSNNLKQLSSTPGGSDLDKTIMSSAFATASAEGELQITEEAANVLVQAFFQGAGERKGQENLEAGNAFLETNKAREGITVTESGLQYEVLTAGTGAKPTAADQVRVHYHGTLINGTVFDSSVDRGEPATFGVGQVIPGWTEALQLMTVGSKWKVYLPSEIAYGERGAGGDIGPNAALIFEVELLEIIAK